MKRNLFLPLFCMLLFIFSSFFLSTVKGGENLCHFQRSKTIPVSAVYRPAFLNLLHLFFLKMNFLWIFFFYLWYAPRKSVSAPANLGDPGEGFLPDRCKNADLAGAAGQG
jgi:hypothetical protein